MPQRQYFSQPKAHRGLHDNNGQPVPGVTPGGSTNASSQSTTQNQDFDWEKFGDVIPETPDWNSSSSPDKLEADLYTEPEYTGQVITLEPEPNELTAPPRFAVYAPAEKSTELIDAADAKEGLGGRFGPNVSNTFKLGSRVLKVKAGEPYGRQTYLEIIPDHALANGIIIFANKQYIVGLQEPQTTSDEQPSPSSTPMCNSNQDFFGSVKGFFTQKRVVCYDTKEQEAFRDDKTFGVNDCETVSKRTLEVQAERLKDLNVCKVTEEPNWLTIGLTALGTAAVVAGVTAIVK